MMLSKYASFAIFANKSRKKRNTINKTMDRHVSKALKVHMTKASMPKCY